MNRTRRLLCHLPLLAAPLTAARAQSFPNRPLRIVVPFPPGGAGDLHTRLVAGRLATVLGQPVIVDNRAGASGNIGAEFVAKAPPDGYTLVFATTNMAINQAVSTKLPFNVTTDFAPISLSLTAQNLLVARPDFAAADLRGLIAMARANPGKVTFGSSGIGSPWLGMELLKSMAGIDLTHVPYKGDAPAITDLIGGQIDLYATNLSVLDPHVRAGRVKPLAVTSRRRAASLPDVPTMEEAGVPGYELESWFGFMAPAGTPRPTIDVLHGALVQVLAMPDVQKSMTDVGLVPTTTSPEQFAARIRADVDKFARIAKAANIKAD